MADRELMATVVPDEDGFIRFDDLMQEVVRARIMGRERWDIWLLAENPCDRGDETWDLPIQVWRSKRA